jgi:hypothetical protein
MIQREKCVVNGRQGGGEPRCRRMACGASRRPACCHMIGIRGAIEIRLVAGVTGRRCAGKDVIDMAADAIHSEVRTGQWEGCVVVIKRCPCPRCGCVAGSAGGGKSRGSMVRVSRPSPIRQVAAVAGCRQRGEVVIRVTLRADQRSMRSRKRERSIVVIERRWTPSAGRMTDRAICRKSGRDVIRTGCPIEVRLMTGVARG